MFLCKLREPTETKKINGNVYDKTVALLPQSPEKIVYMQSEYQVPSEQRYDSERTGQVPLLCLTFGGGGGPSLVHAIEV